MGNRVSHQTLVTIDEIFYGIMTFAIAAMHLTKTLHPPGGATALIAVVGSDRVRVPGFFYVSIPVGLGAVILPVVAFPVNASSRATRHPDVWVSSL